MTSAPARPAWLDPALFPFESRHVELDGHLVHHVDEGSGPTLLMLHGNPTWSFVYRQAITALRDRHRCIALDYPGFGLSRAAPGYGYEPAEHAAVVAAFVEALDLRDVTLVVQDWGGPIGLRVAADAPERFSRLVIGNTWAWPVNGDLHFESFSRAMGGPLGRLLIRQLNLFVNVMLPVGHRARRLSDAEMRHYREALPTPARRQPSAVFPHAILASRRWLAALEADLPRIAHLPSLLVWADRDIAFRQQELSRWEALLPRHETVRLPRAGHFLQSDCPEEFAAAVGDWLARVVPGPVTGPSDA